MQTRRISSSRVVDGVGAWVPVASSEFQLSRRTRSLRCEKSGEGGGGILTTAPLVTGLHSIGSVLGTDSTVMGMQVDGSPMRSSSVGLSGDSLSNSVSKAPS